MTTGKRLRGVRIVVSAACGAAMTLLLSVTGMWIAPVAGWLAKLQFLPAAMGFSMIVFVGWIIATLVLGRVYCSSVCPMGFFQDCVAHAAHMRVKAMKRRRRIYRWMAPLNALRYAVLVVVVAAMLTGIATVPALLDPYSAYGRMCLDLLRPVGVWVVNCWCYPPIKVASAAGAGVIIAAMTMLIIGALAAWRGRLWCSTMCPVGTTLGLVSRYSIFHFDIDTDKCTNCRACEYGCKAQCIDLTDHVVDMSRCVVCFDCTANCRFGAMHYTTRSHTLSLPMMQHIGRVPGQGAATAGMGGPHTMSRRKFLGTLAVLAATPVMLKAERGAKTVAAVAGADKLKPMVTMPILPPGFMDRDTFHSRCTACGLCVAHCPEGVIRPSHDSLTHLLQPVLDYDLGKCLYDCTRCNNLCPTGALQPLTLREKQATVIGRASVIDANCIGCGECVGACPTGAVSMGDNHVAVVDATRCIGCGACQRICPAWPHKAIWVNGVE